MQKIFNIIVDYPKRTLALLLVVVAFFGAFAGKLEIDASTQTLLLENDKDLEIWRQNARKYGSSNFLVAAFAPADGELFSEQSLAKIDKISRELAVVGGVEGVLSLLDMPLLMASNSTFASLLERVPTLKTERNATLARAEFAINPLYKKNIISEDLTTTAIVITLRGGADVESLKANHTARELKAHRDQAREREAQTIAAIRAVLDANRGSDTLFLGGMNMIAQDMIDYVRADLVIFGGVLFGVLALCLWAFFRRALFVALPLGVCAVSVAAAAGVLGFFGYEITVVSSNFIALQLIVTISLIIHLIVAYTELQSTDEHATQRDLVLYALRSRAFACFFAVFTTIVGFLSLCVSDIAPIISLGAMMSLGVAISLVVSFVGFGAVMMLAPRRPYVAGILRRLCFNEMCGEVALRRRGVVFAVAAVAAGLGAWGAAQLKVENSFIGYFKESSEIYRGMKLIDDKLGGTIPFDVVVRFDRHQNVSRTSLPSDDAWFSPQHSDAVLAGHLAAQGATLAQGLGGSENLGGENSRTATGRDELDVDFDAEFGGGGFTKPATTAPNSNLGENSAEDLSFEAEFGGGGEVGGNVENGESGADNNGANGANGENNVGANSADKNAHNGANSNLTPPATTAPNSNLAQNAAANANFHPNKTAALRPATNINDDRNAYWFSQNKLRVARMITLFLQENEFVGYVGSLDLLLQIGKSLNGGKPLDSLTLAILYKTAPESYKQILLAPYVSFADNELHFSARMRDSDPRLRRDEFIARLRADLNELLAGEDASAEVSGVMVLYNNVLQSLFSSQFDTLGLVAGVLFLIFVVIFRSVKFAAFALACNVIPLACVFGVMGALGVPLDIMSITIAAIALGIGVDNAIHYIHRYQAELAARGSRVEAARASSASIGVAMYYTSVTILLGFGTMMLSNFYPTIYFGLFTALVMAMMLLASLTLLPAMLVCCRR